MADQKKRGGQKANKGKQAGGARHQGVHPGSTTQHKDRKKEFGDRAGHEKLVPDKGD